jgi:hypothetical protein
MWIRIRNTDYQDFKILCVEKKIILIENCNIPYLSLSLYEERPIQATGEASSFQKHQMVSLFIFCGSFCPDQHSQCGPGSSILALLKYKYVNACSSINMSMKQILMLEDRFSPLFLFFLTHFIFLILKPTYFYFQVVTG